MSDRTPWEEQELLRDLQEFAAEAKAHAAKRRWLLTFRSADGAERHQSHVGPPPRSPRFPLHVRVGYAPNAKIEVPPPFQVREYEIDTINFEDGTVVYREVVR